MFFDWKDNNLDSKWVNIDNSFNLQLIYFLKWDILRLNSKLHIITNEARFLKFKVFDTICKRCQISDVI